MEDSCRVSFEFKYHDGFKTEGKYRMRSIRLILFLILCLSAISEAQTSKLKSSDHLSQESQFQFFLLNQEYRYERMISQDFDFRSIHPLSFGYRRDQFSTLIEYSAYSEQSGNITSNIERKHQEIMWWGRWHFISEKEAMLRYSSYAGFGLGAYQEEIKTNLLGFSSFDKSVASVESGVSIGGDLNFTVTKTLSLIAGAEGRFIFASDFDPNPVLDTLVRIGIAVQL